MIPEPLHPAVVHLPLALAVLLPISALIALWAIRRGSTARVAWAIPLAFALMLTGSAWIALETGEAEEERVEDIVGEAAIHEHEEAAERFLLFSGVIALVAGVGLIGGVVGNAARLVATAGTAVVLVSAVQVGAAGGELVYERGAAQAYVSGAAGSAPTAGEHEADERGER